MFRNRGHFREEIYKIKLKYYNKEPLYKVNIDFRYVKIFSDETLLLKYL